MVMGILERRLNAEELRSGAIARFTPIHSFLFSSNGRLLYANNRAMAKLEEAGGPPLFRKTKKKIFSPPTPALPPFCLIFCDG